MMRGRLAGWRVAALRAAESRTCSRTCIPRQLPRAIHPSRTMMTVACTAERPAHPGKHVSVIHEPALVRPFSSRSTLPPHEIILMPALSPTMTSGNIGAWHKRVGDRIEPGDVLCEIETDKAQMDFEVQEDGFLAKILIPEGTKEAQVGQPLAIFVTKAEDVAKFDKYSPTEATNAPETGESEATSSSDKSTTAAPSAKSQSQPPAIPASPATEERVKASPLARKTAYERGVDLRNVVGTGPNGRIVKQDVMATTMTSASAPAPVSSTNFVDIPHSKMRRVIASRLTESKQSIPHYYLRVDIEMDKILELRGKFNSTETLQETFGSFKLSVNDFIVKAASLALLQVPTVNSAWHDDFVRQYKTVDICVAVATPNGLITPIVADVDQKGLVTISNQIKELATRAKANKLRPEEFQGGTFTISNLGMFGVDSFTAIINPPQSCILAVGATQARILPGEDGSPRMARVMSVTLSCDHRVVDGATGAQWLAHFKRFLEEPEQMIL